MTTNADIPRIWTHEGQVEAAEAGDVGAAYRLVAPHLNTTFMGEPKADDLRELLRSAYRARARFNEAIEAAEKCLAAK